MGIRKTPPARPLTPLSAPNATAMTRPGTGHIVIGLIQHAARQPNASPETISTAQRLLERQRAKQDCPQFAPRHRATTIGE